MKTVPVFEDNLLTFFSILASDFTMFVLYGGIGNNTAIRVIFSGGGRTTCLLMYKKSTRKHDLIF